MSINTLKQIACENYFDIITNAIIKAENELRIHLIDGS